MRWGEGWPSARRQAGNAPQQRTPADSAANQAATATAGGKTCRPANPHPIASPFDARAPLRLTLEQFARVCAENRDAALELDADGRLITTTPSGSETSGRNSRLVMRLLLWADQPGGWKVFESSAGFRLPDASVPSSPASASTWRRSGRREAEAVGALQDPGESGPDVGLRARGTEPCQGSTRPLQ
jgi:hypothetical protein